MLHVTGASSGAAAAGRTVAPRGRRVVVARRRPIAFHRGMTGTPPSRPTLAAVLRAGPLAERHLLGSRLGPYELVQELGRGAFGLVLRARRTDRASPDVALKVLLDPGERTGTRARRFEREALLSNALEHPGIVPALDAG